MLRKIIIAVLLAASVVLAVVASLKLRDFAQALETHHSVSGGAGSADFIIAIVCLVVAVVLIWSPWQQES